MTAPFTSGRPRSPEDLIRVLQVEAIRDRRVLAAFRKVPRARFVPAAATGQAHLDAPIRKEAGQLLADAWLTPAYFVPLVGIHGIRSREDRNER